MTAYIQLTPITKRLARSNFMKHVKTNNCHHNENMHTVGKDK